MDWSSVYEDQGEEEGDWTREDVCSTRSGLILQSFENRGNYSPIICYAFTVNYILGVGCLGIPFAFFQSGIILGTVLVISLSFISYITVMWVAGASQQEIQLRNYQNSSNPFFTSPNSSKHQKQVAKNSVFSKSGSSKGEFVSFSFGGRSSVNNYNSLDKLNPSSNKLELHSTRKTSNQPYTLLSVAEGRCSEQQTKSIDPTHITDLEVTDLAAELLGSPGRVSYQVALMLLTYVGLLAYTQVFNGSFSSQIWPSCGPLLSSLIFGVIVIPLSCFDLAEQVTLQVVMSVLRFLSLSILLFGTLAAIILDPLPPQDSSNSITETITEQYSSNSLESQHLPLANWSGFGVMFTTAIFSQLFQHSVPGLIRPLSDENKKYIPQIFKYALITTATIYISTGIACVSYFGDHLQQSVNLNFVGFDWGYDRRHDPQGYSDLNRFCISMLAAIVVLFPALDTLSVFPLIANTLGNNLNSAFPFLRDLVTAHYHHLHHNGSRNTSTAEDRASVRRITLTAWRLVAAIPPIVASVFVTDLMFSLQVAGLCGIIVALVTPALLQRQYHLRQRMIPKSLQPMDGGTWFDNDLYSSVVLVLAVLALIISLAQMVSNSDPGADS